MQLSTDQARFLGLINQPVFPEKMPGKSMTLKVITENSGWHSSKKFWLEFLHSERKCFCTKTGKGDSKATKKNTNASALRCTT